MGSALEIAKLCASGGPEEPAEGSAAELARTAFLAAAGLSAPRRRGETGPQTPPVPNPRRRQFPLAQALFETLFSPNSEGQQPKTQGPP